MEIVIASLSAALSCKSDDVKKIFAKNANNESSHNAILGFMRDIHELRSKTVDYFVFGYGFDHNFVSDYGFDHNSEEDQYIYVCLENPEIRSLYQTICLHYSKTNIGCIKIDNVRIFNPKIESRLVIDGPPDTAPNGSFSRSSVGIRWREAKPENLEVLKLIPSHPKDFFVKISWALLPAHTMSRCCYFSADEDKMKALFNFPISMKDRNCLIYMEEYLCLVAGGGAKWCVYGIYCEEFGQLFVVNTKEKT